ncbi:MAG: ATP-binding protein [Gammaproteobacteria bacterium]|nr:ATP-binding protein [Gammaproteobacteria bacterium]MCY4277068.1 ATP-binding protein [Gammaproteobacteria bacterium]MCY4322947.1 ATP-binding protein [Gammaproteobacteria bacterium]
MHPDNPFRPGSGKPPHLAGRKDELDAMMGLVNAALAGKPRHQDGAIYGPRGCGKTALLHTIKDRIPDIARHVLLTPSDLKNEDDVEAQILKSLGARALSRLLPEETEINVQVLRGVWKRQGIEFSDKRGEIAAHTKKHPFILLLDEAHKLPLNVYEKLVHESLALRAVGACVTFILAGKPQLTSMGTRAGVSFSERFLHQDIGLLSQESTSEALVVPFGREGIGISGAVLQALFEDTHGYAYYVQLWGEGLWEFCREHSLRHIDVQAVDSIQPSVRRERERAYQERYSAWTGEDLHLFERINQQLRAMDGLPSKRRLEQMIETELKAQRRTPHSFSDIYHKMVESDYVWQRIGNRSVTFCIPSFSDLIEANRSGVAA